MPTGYPRVRRNTRAADRAIGRIVGHVLREIRADLGLSLHQLAERSDGAVKMTTLGSYERGERMVSIDVLIRLARVYCVDPGVLVSVIERRVQHPGLSGEAVVSASA